MNEQRQRRRPFWYISRRPATVASDVDEEIRLHLEMRIAELTSRGMPAEAARNEAVRRFGDLEYTRRYCRDQDLHMEARMRRGLSVEEFARDLRIALRSLVRLPGLSGTIVLTVGIALGAAVAMIALVRTVLVNPLPYADPESLVWIYTDNPPFRFRLSHVDYRALEADHPAFGGVAAYEFNSATVSAGDLAERVTTKTVTGSYFPLLGQQPHIGRLFDPSDDEHRERLAVLTHAYWTRRFGSDPLVLGRAMPIDGATHTIVGVLQRDVGPLEHNVAAFTIANWPMPKRKGPFGTMVLARLRPDVSRAAALDTLRATNARLFPIWRSSYQDEKATWGFMDLKERAVGDIGTTLLFVSSAIGCLLLIACANAVNLLMARGLHRTRELAIRGALGASRGRLLQHVLMEAAALSGAAALVGLACAVLALRLVAVHGAPYIPRINEVRFALVDLASLAGLSAVAAILIGLIPAWQASRVTVDRTLRSGGRSMTEGPAARRVRRALVAAEFALATPLLVAAALILASLDRLGRVPVGIDTSRVLSAAVSLPGARYARDSDRDGFWKRARLRLSALPGVDAAAIADSRPPVEAGNTNNFDLEDHPTPSGHNQPLCTWVGVSPEFFEAVGLRLERGRLLDDRSVVEDVIVVDRAWANRFFPGEDVMGRRLRSGGCTTCPWTTVVGLVGNVRWRGLDAPEDGTVYYPLVDPPNAFVILRTSGDPSALAPGLRQAVKELDPALPLSNVATGDELVASALTTPRYLTGLTGLFALSAVMLAVVGIYGVMSHFVQQHRRDIGIRLALGGDPARVRRAVVSQGMALVIAGVAGGTIAALAASRLVTTLLYGVSPTDPRMIIGVPAGLVAVAILACLLPAQRAARLDPARILRED
jgi:predicted permease